MYPVYAQARENKQLLENKQDSLTYNQVVAFEDQVPFVFFIVFGDSHHDQIILTVGHRYASDIVECQAVFDFTVFGI